MTLLFTINLDILGVLRKIIDHRVRYKITEAESRES